MSDVTMSLAQFKIKCLSRKAEVLETREVSARKYLQHRNLSEDYLSKRLTCKERTEVYCDTMMYSKTKHNEDPSDCGYVVFHDKVKDRYTKYR